MCFLFPPIDTNHNIYDILRTIQHLTEKWNLDNISRTKAYFQYFQTHPEIEWSFLASMVSRNAGYNMCDLEGMPLRDTLSPQYRNYLFLTYEKANFLIFKDVFPQLLLYHYSTLLKEKMFHFLPQFFVTAFMESEWEYFWECGDRKRLMTALIINEQNVIQKPVIENPFFQQNVFQSKLFWLQDALKMNAVLFPTIYGELYGLPVHHFRKLEERIQLGKGLANILFDDQLFARFYQFAYLTEHTGSRMDYEQYFSKRKRRTKPFLRVVYPVIQHPEYILEKWDENRRIRKKWFSQLESPDKVNNITQLHKKKSQQLERFSYLYRFMK